MTNIKKQYMIKRYNNRQTMAMAAILNKKNPPAWILMTFQQGVK